MKTLYTQEVAAPIFYSDADSYTKTQIIIIRSETEGATIYYTLDGTEPTTNSLVYTTPISISATTTIRAFATSSGMNDSYVSSATYAVALSATVSTDTNLEDIDLREEPPGSKESEEKDRVFGVDNAIVVRSKSVSYFSISDLSGQVITSGIANVGENYVEVLTGNYLVQIGNETYKVVVK